MHPQLVNVRAEFGAKMRANRKLQVQRLNLSPQLAGASCSADVRIVPPGPAMALSQGHLSTPCICHALLAGRNAEKIRLKPPATQAVCQRVCVLHCAVHSDFKIGDRGHAARAIVDEIRMKFVECIA
ncbi:hypothetical protein LA5095_01173 [Roseibium album]|uniref:Uncharacterized protein n=1 Tax=Roseibium album TaxID=311410 RepID=A0A0M7A1Y6_9HYPH|nr:hypothetical protein LA5094_00717 [Roseibium album]CTQ67723.1 hypothetical protein LA5095_01173 [Roseibium album]CTQ70215.1 hypothetical protein LA5096_02428 [Roseibium album]